MYLEWVGKHTDKTKPTDGANIFFSPHLIFPWEAKVIKFIPLTSDMPLDWDHLQHLHVLNLGKDFSYKLPEIKRLLELGQ